MKSLFSKMMLLVTMLMLILSMSSYVGAAATNNLFTATISTFAVTDTGKLADINLLAVQIKSITIAQTAATAETITIYKNANSTTTMTAVAVYQVPATIGTYNVFPFYQISTTLTAADTINIPYFAVRSSTSTSASTCKINVEYWK